MSLDADAYRRTLAALLPRGLAWPREPCSVLQRLLGAWADELARVDGRGDDLLEEAFPNTAAELLSEWEIAFGLPDVCGPELAPEDLAGRRAALWAKVITTGGQSPAYFLALAAALDWDVALIEHRRHTVGQTVEAPLHGDPWAYTWELHSDEGAEVTNFTAASAVSAPLATWADWRECLFRRLKPAHTHLLFSYGIIYGP